MRSTRRWPQTPGSFLLGEDLADPGGGVVGVTKGLSTKYGPDRVLDTPISEAAIAGAAIGAALEGQIPVAEIMIMDFIGIAIDQIVNLAAKAVHVRRPDAVSRHRSHCDFRWVGIRRYPFAVPRGLVHAHPRAQGHRSEHPGGRQRSAHVGDLRSGSLFVHGDGRHLRRTGTGAR